MNPYDVLELPADATDAEIKAAYKAKAQKAHPDRAGGNLAEFKAVNEAYRSLKERIDVKMRELFAIILDNDSFHGDIVAEAKRIADGTISRARTREVELTNSIARMKLKRPRVDNELFCQVVDDRIARDEQSLTLVRQDVAVWTTLIERLAECKDNNPDPQWMPAGGFGGV